MKKNVSVLKFFSGVYGVAVYVVFFALTGVLSAGVGLFVAAVSRGLLVPAIVVFAAIIMLIFYLRLIYGAIRKPQG